MIKITVAFPKGNKLLPAHEVAAYDNLSMIMHGHASLEARYIGRGVVMCRFVEGVTPVDVFREAPLVGIRGAIDGHAGGSPQEIVITPSSGGDSLYRYMYPGVSEYNFVNNSYRFCSGLFIASFYGYFVASSSLCKARFLLTAYASMGLSRARTPRAKYDFGMAVSGDLAKAERRTLCVLYETEY